MARVSVATDNFNRASLGADWAQLSQSDGGAISIDSSTRINGQTGNGQDNAAARWVGAGTFTADQYASIKLLTLDYQNLNFWSGVIVRASADTDAARDYYLAILEHNSGGPTYTTRVAKIVNGTYTSLASTTQTWAVNDLLSLEVEGTSLRVFRNSTQITALNVTDASLSTGAPGVIGSQVMFMDDFEGGNITSSSEATVTPAQAAVALNGRTPSTSVFSNVRIRQVLVTESGSLAGDRTGINLAVWYSGSPVGAPDVSLAGLTTDPNGTTSWSIATGTLAFNQAVFMVAYSGTPPDTYTCGRLVPNYE